MPIHHPFLFTSLRMPFAGGRRIRWLLAVSAALTMGARGDLISLQFGAGDLEFDMVFTRVGEPGNFADETGAPNPVGSVPYAFYMGRHEVSEKMVSVANSVGSLGISFDSRYEEKPATGVSWNEAARFVNWLNTSHGFSPAYKFDVQPGEAGYSANANIALWSNADPGYNPDNPFRNAGAIFVLPTVDEWYKAAYFDPNKVGGPGYWNYATRSDSAPNAIAGNGGAGTAVYNQPQVQGPADITSAGGLSAYGTTAQGGNVWEWVETAFDGVNSTTNESRAFRGGGWNSGSVSLASNLRNPGGPSAATGNLGFRVSMVPEPIETAGVTTLTLLGFLLWRRHSMSRT
jgi:sulfatase modifying factor 1